MPLPIIPQYLQKHIIFGSNSDCLIVGLKKTDSALLLKSTKILSEILGILLIYFIGKYFYDLAQKHGKGPWPYAILGVVAYYAGTFIGGVILGIGIAMFSTTPVEEINEMFFSFLSIPFGILACWGTYLLLQKNWSKKNIVDSEDILDSDLL